MNDLKIPTIDDIRNAPKHLKAQYIFIRHKWLEKVRKEEFIIEKRKEARIYNFFNKDKIKEWREANKEKIKEYYRTRYKNNIEMMRQKNQEWRDKNREYYNKKAREYYKKRKQKRMMLIARNQ
jgi:hypothetical protein